MIVYDINDICVIAFIVLLLIPMGILAWGFTVISAAKVISKWLEDRRYSPRY